MEEKNFGTTMESLLVIPLSQNIIVTPLTECKKSSRKSSRTPLPFTVCASSQLNDTMMNENILSSKLSPSLMQSVPMGNMNIGSVWLDLIVCLSDVACIYYTTEIITRVFCFSLFQNQVVVSMMC